MRGIVLAVAALAIASRATLAQVEPEALRVGQRLRVFSIDPRQNATGRLLYIAHDTLWLRRPDQHDTLRYLSPMVRQLQTATGMTANEGAITGAAFGFVGIIAIASYHPRAQPAPVTCFDCTKPPSTRIWLLPLATAAGGLAGAFLARSRWLDVRWPPLGEWVPETVDRGLARGRHVRIDTVGQRFSGFVLERRADTLVMLGPDPYRDTLHIPTANIKAVAVETGRSRGQRQLTGLVTGAGVGVLASYFAASLHSCRGCEDVAHDRARWLVPLGAIAGLLIGSHGDEKWTPLPWPP